MKNKMKHINNLNLDSFVLENTKGQDLLWPFKTTSKK